jgi:BlaI family transcriptional regulator, penicillinase repressor
MERLTKAEEPIMRILWEIEKGFVKDILSRLPDPKPPYNTVSSVIRILVKKGFVSFKTYGKTYEYYPAISRASYKRYELSALIANYFDGSHQQLVSFLVSKESLSRKELNEIRRIIDQNR